jgi:hypothetical protein
MKEETSKEQHSKKNKDDNGGRPGPTHKENYSG